MTPSPCKAREASQQSGLLTVRTVTCKEVGMSDEVGISGESMTWHIIEKSMKDPTFRQRLLANPKTTIEEETGRPYSPGVRVKVVEEDPDVVVLAIPKMPPAASGELSDAELEMVSGGEGSALFCGSTATWNLVCFRCGVHWHLP